MTTSRPALRAFIAYTGARLLLFGLVFGLCVLLGLGGFVVLVGAFLVSGALSYVVLGRQRTAFGRVVEESVGRRRLAHDTTLTADDAVVDPGADG